MDQNKYNHIRAWIESTTDGPVTNYVVISRGCEWAAKHGDSPELKAALYDILFPSDEE